MSLSKSFRQIVAAAFTISIYSMKNFPINFISSILSPLGLLLLIVIISHGALFRVGVIGALITSIIYAGTGLQGDVTHLRTDIKFQDMLVSSPMTMSNYIIGVSIGELIYELPSIIVSIILIAIYIKISLISYFMLLIISSLFFVFLVSLSFFLSTSSREIIESWAYSSLFSMLLSLFSPVYYPLTALPSSIRYLAFISPSTYPAILAQFYTGTIQYPYTLIIKSWIVLVALTIFSLIFAIKRSKWRET